MQPQSPRFALLWIFAGTLLAERVPNRYIVELTTPSVAEQVQQTKQKVRSIQAESHRARIQAEHASLRAQIESGNAKVLDTVETVTNALFVETTDPSALGALPNVKRVVPVRMMHMLLDRAVLLHKVADAWNQIGGTDNAGAGSKIAIIDTGIDVSHPGFQDSSLTLPDGFPKVNAATDTSFTNNKVIVARSYVQLLPNRDPDSSARDRVGHGTALAMTAAGVRNAGPLATITGVAPKAYLGSYKVFGTPGYNDNASDDAILKAIDDAVADGMDVISLSLGDPLAPRLSDDVDAQAVERATKAGVIVVVAAGNAGPDLNTIASPGTAPSAITVGAVSNDRTFASTAELQGLAPFIAYDGNGPTPPAAITGTIVDVGTIDTNGLACGTLPSNSLSNKIALILRGTCTFETKLNNAQRAGATAALLYAAASSPDPIYMDVGAATLPAQMISFDSGTAIKNSLGQSATATLQFTLHPVPLNGNRLTDFSAAGPNVDGGIKPDLAAVGENIYVATQTADPNGDMYNSSGYVLVDGTSFSTPLVAGAAALLKAARPGLTVDQYRSMLINSAAALQAHTGGAATIQQSGTGSLDMSAALRANASVTPVSLSFGSGGGDAQANATLTLTNTGSTDDTFTLTPVASKGGVTPALGMPQVKLAAGASATVPVAWSASGMTAGTYEGVITISSASTGGQQNVPYWYAATGGAANVVLLDGITSARRGSIQKDALLIRVTDQSGVTLADFQPAVTVVSGGGTVTGLHSHDSDVPGLIGVDVQLGLISGSNVFQIDAGSASIRVAITGR